MKRDTDPEGTTVRMAPRPAPAADARDTVIDRRAPKVEAGSEPRRTVADSLLAPLALVDTPEARYRVIESIGRGGMGEVSRTFDARLGREIALKSMLPTDPKVQSIARARFLREARVQALLEHPAIVPVYDIGVGPEGLPYFTMKRIRGETLFENLEQARVAVQGGAKHGLRRLLVKMVTVCLALNYAHERGVIHRDLKPENVMLGPHGEVYVLDWGVAKIMRPADAEPRDDGLDESTQPGEMIGTAGFMPPEQVLGNLEQVDAQSDLYALGALLYEVLTLRRYHEGRDATAVLESTLNPSRRKPEPVPADVPPELFLVAQRCTSWSKLDRPASAREIADAIERYLDGDRDEGMRRKLADDRAELARSAAREALSGPALDREAARATAMQQAGRALALAPEHAGAAEVVVQMLATPPETIPAEAARELDELERSHLRSAVRDNALRIAAWAIAVPIPVLMGLRVPWLAAAIMGLYGLCTLAAVLLWRAETTSRAARLGLYVATCVFASSVAAVFGPLVLVPGFAAMNTIIFSAQATRRERPLLIALGTAVICVPLGLELVGLLPPSMRFEADAIVLLPRVAHFHPAMSLTFLVTVSLLGIVTPTLLTGRLREALRRAEKGIVVQNWQLGQLSPRGLRGR